MRWRTIRQHDILHESVKVLVVRREIIDVALAPIAQLPIRAALATPIEGRDRKSATTEVADDLKVLFDLLRPSLEQANRALRAAGRRPPSGEPERHSVAGLSGTGDSAVGNRI